MKTIAGRIATRWHYILVGMFIIAASLMYLIVGENSYIAIPDNLDLFVAQYKMMKNTGTFWAHAVDVPFLNGISRDNLPGEFYLYSILYMIFPTYIAYIAGYILKIIIALVSCLLLCRDFLPDEKPGDIAWICAFAYGILNLFPAFGICFASIPLVIYFLRKIYRLGFSKPAIKYYVLLFLYPVVSYFSYFGMFILGYLVLAIIWRLIADKKLSLPLCVALVILSAGFVIFEYRLFGAMLFSDEVTIRSTMKDASMSFSEIFAQCADVFKNGMMHADDAHSYFVLPVCTFYFFFLNIRYIIRKDFKGMVHDIYNLFAVLLVFNSFVYGIYYSEGMRDFVALVLPPLTGWQFNRTIFFSPFLWYASLFIICIRMAKRENVILRLLARMLPVAAVFVILLGSKHYNDLYDTAYGTLYKIRTGHEVDRLNYSEFYSSELFDTIKNDVGYNESDWAVAYGMHPAVLEYNGISTLDGYLGFYSQEYKEKFRRVIAPALERKENTRIYFDDWGARCYLYSGTDDSIVMATRSMTGVTDNNIYIEDKALSDLGCRYIFSRIELENADEKNLTLRGEYEDSSSPYKIYVYELKKFKTRG
ncbi:DUF6044 family protein [Butyrivibrio sp. FC2001]|uniref:DUF6044 family protein n=1 Tax=Butyrivibrio sp. FC2001 TaxID=1280671 RepID=UPI0003F57530|nr:DUF6044 family protein [Butyrivibrio sp. FC2001]